MRLYYGKKSVIEAFLQLKQGNATINIVIYFILEKNISYCLFKVILSKKRFAIFIKKSYTSKYQTNTLAT